MGRFYSVTKVDKQEIFQCRFCDFKTKRRGDMLRHHNPNDPNRCKERNWETPGLVMLVAGIGERLRPLTYTKPKALIEFDGLTITEMCLDAFSELGVTEAVLIIGHLGNMIKEHIGKRHANIDIHYIDNPFYSVTGGAHSLWLARQFFEDKPCIIMDGDHLIDKRLLNKLMAAPYENCMLVDDERKIERFEDLSEETVIVGRDGIIKYLAWSPTGELFRMVEPEDVVGEAVIIVKLGACASTTLSYEIDRYIREEYSRRLEIITPLNRTFEKHDTWYIGTKGFPWIEIDFGKDLEKSREEIFPAIMQQRESEE